MKKKKWSKYNILFSREGVFLFYNSLTNSFVSLSEKLYNYLSYFRTGDEVELENKELEANLTRMKAIVEDDAFEIKKIRYTTTVRRFQCDSLHLTLNPTLGCNFGCPYCFEESKRIVRMNDETENRIIDFIIKSSPKMLGVTWFGGEPLLEFNRITSLTKRILSLGTEYKAHMITNGYLLTEEVADRLEELKIKSVQITLDGVGKQHDDRRFLKGGGATFNKIYNNILMCAEHAPNVRINIRVNIDKTNFSAFIDVYRLFNHKYKNIAVSPAFVSDIDSTEQLPCALNINERFNYLKSLSREYGLEYNRFYPDYNRIECSVRNRNTVVIGPEGELYKCWNDVGKPNMVYGNLSDGVTNDKILYDYLIGADPFDDDTCRQCFMLPVCPGGCPHVRLLDEKNGTRNACPLNMTNLEDYLWEHYIAKCSHTESQKQA